MEVGLNVNKGLLFCRGFPHPLGSRPSWLNVQGLHTYPATQASYPHLFENCPEQLCWPPAPGHYLSPVTKTTTHNHKCFLHIMKMAGWTHLSPFSDLFVRNLTAKLEWLHQAWSEGPPSWSWDPEALLDFWPTYLICSLINYHGSIIYLLTRRCKFKVGTSFQG